MEEVLSGIQAKLGEIFSSANWPADLGQTILMLLLLFSMTWLMTIFIVKVVFRRTSPSLIRKTQNYAQNTLNREVFLRQGWWVASCITALILTSYIVYGDFTDTLEIGQSKYSFLSPFNLFLGILSTIVFAIFSFRGLVKTFNTQRANIQELPLTPSEKGRFVLAGEKHLKLIKWAILIPLLGFLVGSPFWNKSYRNLIVIVLDNSTSMEDPINRGKAAINAALNGFPTETEVILSTLTNGSHYDRFSALSRASEMDSLSGKPIHFESKISAQDYLGQIEADNPDSPILEATWKTILYAREYLQDLQFDAKILIVVSDGGDNMRGKDGIDDYFCSYTEFNEIFSPENVFFIDVTGSDNHSEIPFFQEAYNCGFQVRQGTDQGLYQQGVLEAMEELKQREIYFTILVFIICLLAILITAFINPKKV